MCGGRKWGKGGALGEWGMPEVGAFPSCGVHILRQWDVFDEAGDMEAAGFMLPSYLRPQRHLVLPPCQGASPSTPNPQLSLHLCHYAPLPCPPAPPRRQFLHIPTAWLASKLPCPAQIPSMASHLLPLGCLTSPQDQV